MKAQQALKILKEGNDRFQAAVAADRALEKKVRREDMARPQTPFAIILGCSDSRVPAELVFDQGLGDLFVIRVAGNVVAPSQIGSIEFACQQFGTELVVVMGHTQCGAVTATVDAMLENPNEISPNIMSIVERVKPAVMPIIEDYPQHTREQLLKLSGPANVRHSVFGLEERSETLAGLIRENRLQIVGAEYAIETGKVEFFDD